MSTAAERWSQLLAEWAIPDEILAQAEVSPYVLPVARFVGRADDAVRAPRGWSYERAASALTTGGSVLDVGSGAGAASLPLAQRIGEDGLITAVDSREEMLEAFETLATQHPCRFQVVHGAWPQVAHEVAVHDVVVAHHVVYNVPDLVPFLSALTSHARIRVVVELPPRHPLSWANPLWERFWGLTRPTRPTSDDFVAVLEEMGLRDIVSYKWQRDDVDHSTEDQRVALAAQRVCLPPARYDEVREALKSMDSIVPRGAVTVAWTGSA